MVSMVYDLFEIAMPICGIEKRFFILPIPNQDELPGGAKEPVNSNR